MEELDLDEDFLNQLFEGDFHENEEGATGVSVTGSFSVGLELGPDPKDMEVRQAQVDMFLNDNQNQNTLKKTETDLRKLNNFLFNKGEMREIQFIPPNQLDLLICEFLVSAQKRCGGAYEPSTVRGFVSSFDRHLAKHRYPFTIIKSNEFYKTRQVLKTKQKTLKAQGKGNKPFAADPLGDEMLAKLYESGALGDGSPDSLLHSLWLVCTVQFGMRTGQETHALRWGDVSMRKDETGTFLCFDTERQTKTRTGDNPRKDSRQVKPRAYSTETPATDPIHLYQLYKAKRPAEMLSPESPFFLAVANKSPKADQRWYKNAPLGINSLYSVMKRMLKDAGLETDARITPYSVRKHLIQKLSDHNVPAQQIVQISGHKNVNSLNNYSKLNPEQAKKISTLLSSTETPSNPDQRLLPTHSLSDKMADENCSRQPDCSRDNAGTVPQMFSGNVFHAPVTFNFDSKTSLSNTQTAIYSPKDNVHRPTKWKRLRIMDSDSDSDF